MPITREYATGKRKNAIARAWIFPGTGTIEVNARSFENYFPRPSLQTMIESPFTVVGLAGKYDVKARVYGGGSTGQAGAMRHAIAKALVSIDSALREPLKKEGFLTRDSRKKERKKYGQKGARKRFQYSKR